MKNRNEINYPIWQSLVVCVLTTEMYESLDKQGIVVAGGIQLINAIKKFNKRQRGISAYEFEGKRYDVGETLGFVLTSINGAEKQRPA